MSDRTDIKVTIFVATYNQDEFLEKAIDSALEQDYPNHLYEIIVIDDGSTDNTLSILSKYKNRIRFFHQDKSYPLRDFNQ